VTIRRPVRMARLIDRNRAKIADLTLLDGTITADEGWAPYGQAQAVIARPSVAVLARLDPEAKVSVEFELADDESALAVFNGTEVFRLALVARRFNDDGSVALSLATGEQYLQDYRLPWTNDDISAWANQSSLNSIVYNIVNRALGPGFTLNFDAVDTSFNTYSELTNLVENPSFEIANAEGWTPMACDVERVTDWVAVGNYSGRINPKGTTPDTYAKADPGMTAGGVYTLSATFRNHAGQSGTLDSRARRMTVVATINGRARTIASSDPGPSAPYASARLSMTFKVPATAAATEIRLYNGSFKTGEFVFWDAVMLTEGNQRETNNITAVNYFDGDTANNSAYAYQWDGDRNQSSSTRIPILDRPPESLTWSPGQSAWDLLTSILNEANKRLFCDLSGQFNLVDNSYRDRQQKVVVAYGENLYRLDELQSRTATQPDGTPLYADGVLITYSWRDRNGVDRQKIDYAGPSQPQKLYAIERKSTGYPGAKAAGYLLARLRARRVMQSVTAAEDFTVRPAREITITSAPGTTRTGYVSAVTWDLTTAEMTITTKELVSS
jgi:hypothetical protein